MLTELCQYLKNWFEIEHYSGKITITSGSINVAAGDGWFFSGVTPSIQNGQYIRIEGSVFNDGVCQFGVDTLIDETFNGDLWLLGIPKAVIDLASDIAEWRQKYEGINSQAMSPFQSESFKGYSYSKGSASSTAGTNGISGWQAAFNNRISPWRKI